MYPDNVPWFYLPKDVNVLKSQLENDASNKEKASLIRFTTSLSDRLDYLPQTRLKSVETLG